jgi:serine/threonine protein kinase
VNKLLHGKNFEVIREINKGCQGSTYTGFYKSEDEQTKRKAILKKYSLYDDNQGFRDELKVLAKIKGKKDEGKLHGFPDIYSYKFNKNFGEIVLSNSGQDFNSFIVEQLDPFMRHRRHDKESYE